MANFLAPIASLKEEITDNLPSSSSEVNKVIVQVTTLTKEFQEHNIKDIDFIKIDVEGNEMKTLRGAKKTILKFKPMLMVEMEQRHHKEPLWDLMAEIEGWGYAAQYLDRATLTLNDLSEEFVNSQNAIFVKDYQNYINNIIFTVKS